MRRSRVLFLALATAGLFWIAGIAAGYYAIPDPKGKSAECIILSNDLENLTYRGSGTGGEREQSIVDRYNAHCR